MGKGYSIEAQITGEKRIAGIQFEVTPCVAPGKQQKDRQLIIRNLRGENLWIEVNSSDTVATVMRKIDDLSGVETSEQRLIYKGKQLEHCKKPSVSVPSNAVD